MLLGLLSPVALAGAAAVAMPERHAADVAEAVLRDGGNAVDASIAAAFVLAVTYPEAGNIGGGGFATVWMNDQPAFIDFRERAPGRARRDMYLDEGSNFRQRDSLVGVRAAGVPGTVHGLWQLHQRFATRDWAELLTPAIGLARDGFIVPTSLAEGYAETAEFLAGETNFARYFSGLEAGQRFRQPDLAATLERIAANPEDFYRGRTAALLVAQMEREGGLISAEDLAAYRSEWREPLRGRWRDLDFIVPPPPSSGGVALLQLLAMREQRSDLFDGLWQNSPAYLHLLAELEKRVFADRAAYLGDPDFVSVPVAALLDETYLAKRAASIRIDAITAAEAVPPGLESSDTTHFSILDGNGNAVSLTYTLNWSFGNGVVVEGAGFLLNNEMDDFSAKVGVANKFGVVGSEANAIAGGKRMLSSMTPTLALRDGEIALVVGTPGGSTIFTSVFQAILNHYAFGMPVAEAVATTRFHHQLPEATLLRHDQRPIPEATRRSLEGMGYRLEPNSWGNLGDVQMIVVDGERVDAAADPRGRGSARVFALDVPTEAGNAALAATDEALQR